MNLIVCVSKNWGIGKNGHLLFTIPHDMQSFKSKTMGKTVIMGKKTLDSFPAGKPLTGRNNIVLTRDKDFMPEGVTVCHSPDMLLDEIEKYNSEDVFVIGGGEIYKQLLPYCEKAYVTKVFSASDADTYMPNLDENPQWTLTDFEDFTDNGYSCRFCIYEKIH